MTNEYSPWESEGITELEYTKRSRIRDRQEVEEIYRKLEGLMDMQFWAGSICTHCWEVKDRAHLLYAGIQEILEERQ